MPRLATIDESEIGVSDCSHRPCLAPKAYRLIHVHMRKRLDGHGAVELQVQATIHDAHRTGTDPLQEPELTREDQRYSRRRGRSAAPTASSAVASLHRSAPAAFGGQL